jgi:hypothetical protein
MVRRTNEAIRKAIKETNETLPLEHQISIEGLNGYYQICNLKGNITLKSGLTLKETGIFFDGLVAGLIRRTP